MKQTVKLFLQNCMRSWRLNIKICQFLQCQKEAIKVSQVTLTNTAKRVANKLSETLLMHFHSLPGSELH